MPSFLPVELFPGPVDGRPLLPQESGSDIQFFDRLKQRTLQLQHCGQCHRARFPVAPVCPYCQSSMFEWQRVEGFGRIHSWVRYHRTYLSQFASLVPYIVLAVELTSGPILFGRLLDRLAGEPEIGSQVFVALEKWNDDIYLPAFRLREGAS